MRTRKVILAVGLVRIDGLLAACGSNGADAATSAASNSQMASGGTMSMSAASADDVSFAQLMIPHHQQAVTMADLALQQASSTANTNSCQADHGRTSTRDRENDAMAPRLGRTSPDG